MSTEDRRPFVGIKVLDVTRVLAGPFATYQLAILGAEVIKIEDPESGGDTLRYRRGSNPDYGANGMATFFLSQSANKKSVTLNLRTETGREIFRDLAKDADVVVENLRSGAMESYGLGYDDLARINPRLILCSVTGYGQTGPKRRHPAYDPVIQAASGMMSITGTAESAPLKLGPPIADYGTGLAAAFGIATALFERERSGKGQHVDVSMLDVALVMMGNLVTEVLTAGSTPKPHGNKSPAETYGNTCFRCADGRLIAIAAMEEHHRARLWQAMGRNDIPADPRFACNEARIVNVEALHEEMGKTFLERAAQEWEDLLNAVDVPAMRVRSIPEAIEQPQLEGRNLLHTIDAVPGIRGGTTVTLAPFMLSAGGARVDSPPPPLGAHTDAILKERGYTEEHLSILRTKGIL